MISLISDHSYELLAPQISGIDQLLLRHMGDQHEMEIRLCAMTSFSNIVCVTEHILKHIDVIVIINMKNH